MCGQYGVWMGIIPPPNCCWCNQCTTIKIPEHVKNYDKYKETYVLTTDTKTRSWI